MKKLFFAIVLAAMFAMPMTASAEKIDFGKLKCSAFIELDAQTMTMFYFWLDGYASAKTGDTKLDAGAVENNLTQIMKVCQKNPNKSVLSIVAD
jgi:hypothetical protein